MDTVPNEHLRRIGTMRLDLITESIPRTSAGLGDEATIVNDPDGAPVFAFAKTDLP